MPKQRKKERLRGERDQIKFMFIYVTSFLYNSLHLWQGYLFNLHYLSSLVSIIMIIVVIDANES